LITEFTIEQARIGTGGLYFDTRRAIDPVSVTVMIKSMFKSSTVDTDEEAIASDVPSGAVVYSLMSLKVAL
jgi:hypothetical protein